MPFTVSKYCDSASAFRFNSDCQARLGHVTALKVDGKDITADLTIRDPMNPQDASKTVKVVGVINAFAWNLEITGSFDLSMQVSDDNKTELLGKLLKGIQDTSVEAKFTVYEYDTPKKKYFKAVDTDDKNMKGSIKLNGTDRMIAISEEPSQEVEQPTNFRFEISITPAREQQVLNFAVREGANISKQWGTTQGSA
ncbi:hypothetical protein [Candidatus Uabimicrobium amorphum]|uniref:Uncharacterized protein n=1 Tax=Uabimicrobium amorphum TaxID=2596890 RepID=A0A5S9IRP3_UABAM|nr:hypothetical protein [Candidatus Uabimicrobium amorphum]BBM86664.1 hypothetical protein UABAM_05050 [Candidatus Uabimicrobium amorphum]